MVTVLTMIQPVVGCHGSTPHQLTTSLGSLRHEMPSRQAGKFALNTQCHIIVRRRGEKIKIRGSHISDKVMRCISVFRQAERGGKHCVTHGKTQL